MEFQNKKIKINKQPYIFEKQIGQGSHAQIWIAKAHFYPYQQIIIKVAQTPQNTPAERVLNESKYLQSFRSVHIPKLLDYGHWNGYPWLAMPIYQPLTLYFKEDNKIQTTTPEDFTHYPENVSKVDLKTRENVVTDIIHQIGTVLSLLAEANTIHADISPGNIMENTQSHLEKHYILTDFGATYHLQSPPIKTYGSLHFTAPERFLGKPHITSDVFSLGSLCYYILTGTTPYFGKDSKEYCLNALERDEISPMSQIPEINPTLNKQIQEMIRYKPENRPDPREFPKKT